MASLHVLQHVSAEGPARVGEVARDLGLGVEVYRVHDGVAVPETIPRGDAVVVMGGAMGVGDIGDARWPFLKGEADLLARLLGDGRPVLGICLGAQLIAHALGARVYPLEVGEPPVKHREVGWGAVTFAVPTESEPSLVGLDPSEVVLHWHGDTFDLPGGATLLASTLPCENQMFRFGQRAFGLQFHVELGAADVDHWVREDSAFVRAANGPEGGDRILAETRRYGDRYRQVGDRMIRNILAAMLR